MLSGVMAGLAEHFGYDPTLWRLAFLIFVVITGGAMLFVYLAAWIMVPKRPAIMPLDPSEYEVR
jgi:phage shock protein PspC (stress-responsive transcriptional regulator)